MIGAGSDCTWKILALVDLLSPSSERVVHNALSLAARLHAEVTLLSVVPRRAYERGVRYDWPQQAYGQQWPEVDVHRVALPGDPAVALAVYADRIRADVLVVPAEYNLRRWFWKSPLAPLVAVLTSRALWIVPPAAGIWAEDRELRVGCVVRLDGTDDRVCAAAESVVSRCGGQVVLTYTTGRKPTWLRSAIPPIDRDRAVRQMEELGRSLHVPWTALVVESRADRALCAAAVENDFGLIVTGRPMYVRSAADSGDLLSAANRLACPVLSVPFSVSTPACVAAPRSTATA